VRPHPQSVRELQGEAQGKQPDLHREQPRCEGIWEQGQAPWGGGRKPVLITSRGTVAAGEVWGGGHMAGTGKPKGTLETGE
jgi:hypothetical protein